MAGDVALSGDGAAKQTAKPALTPEQKAARKKLLATAAYMKETSSTVGPAQHHFPAPKEPFRSHSACALKAQV